MSARRAVVALVLGLLAVLPAVAFAGTPAHAHSSQIGSTPAAGEEVAIAPDRVVVSFDSPLMDVGAALVVRSPDGTTVTVAPAVVEANEISVAVRQDVPAGQYTVAFRVVSQDGHTVSSSYAYTVATDARPPSTTAPPAAATAPSATSSAAEPDDGPAAPVDEATEGGLTPYLAVAAVLLALTVAGVGAIALRR